MKIFKVIFGKEKGISFENTIYKKLLGECVMFQVIDFLCLVCIGFLVLDVMVYFCKDAMDIFESTTKVNKVKSINVWADRVRANSYSYENKIAK
ncbi:hypothetical protein CDIFMA2_37730 [Clostridioides difficile]|nr:hypothetical protein CDIFMA2_37730 [Clostridioides difficile]